MSGAFRKGWQGPALGIVFSIGFFGLVAQTLLFRLFLTVFEGNELGIACFFSSWLAWVAAGALFARLCRPVANALIQRFEWLPLLYLPAFALQWWLIDSAREIAGVQPYELFPLFTVLPVSFLANAPVSFCTGLLFPLGCRWLNTARGSPVAKVYVWECVGSFVGGVTVTLLLARGVAAETLFVWAALPMTLALAAYRLGRRSIAIAVLPALAVAAALAWGIPQRWERHNNLRTWQRLLPTQAFRGSFTTPEAKYLYGDANGQFNVVSWETVTDTIPNTEHASEIIALHLAQRPNARRFLVAGRGAFSICRRLLELPQAESIVWFDPDPAYPARLRSVLPARFTAGTERLETPPGDLRRWLAQPAATYDLIVLNLPDVTTLALNRYFTREFFLLLRAHLSPSGALGVRVSAGENYMSEDRLNAGASVFHTLRSVFPYMALKPGDESWLIVSDSPGLTTAPAVLRERFAAIAGADRLYPPAGLMSLYAPLRIADQLEGYERAGQGATKDLLLNTDRAPKALLHGLLFAAREAGGAVSLGGFIRTFALFGAPVLPLGLLVFVFLRSVFRLRSRGAPGAADSAPSSMFDSYALVFTTGAAGLGCNIVLMYLYQSVFGSLFLHAGLIAALFMLGLAVGGAVTARFLTGSPRRSPRALCAALLLHGLLCGGIALLAGQASPVVFAAAFALSGLFAGVYVPAAAVRLEAAGVAREAVAAGIESLDHLGGAVGGLVVGLLLLPVFGTSYGLAVLALLLVINATALWRLERTAGERPRKPVRVAGYFLFGLAAFVLMAGLLLRRGGADPGEQAFLAFARASAGQNELQGRQHTLPDGKTLQYFALPDTQSGGKPAARQYAFRTDALAPDVAGYGGPLALAALVGADGTLRNVAILPSRETPAYLDYLRPWLARLRGRNLFVPDPLKDVDAVTGATLTSAAALKILRKAGPAFAGGVLGLSVGPATAAPSHPGAYQDGVWLAVTMVVALVLRRRPSRRLRRGFLLLIAAGSGFLLNAQYSLANVFSLLECKLPPLGWNTAFVLGVGVPLLVVLFGNVYCGYLCPFGALQELVGHLRPASLRTDPDKAAWGRARFMKYGALAFLTLLFGATLQSMLASADPLVTVFARERSPALWCAALPLVGLAFFYPRFWCRCLCPSGAFLALLNKIRLFRRFVPPVVPPACVYGVRDNRELDCLCCDRCRRPERLEEQALARPAGWKASRRVNAGLLTAAAVLAGLIAVRAGSALSQANAGWHADGVELRAGGARPVDMKRLQNLIKQGRLSDHEALFYKPAQTRQ